MSMNRRVFLRKTAYYGLGAATLPQLIQTFSLTNALADTPTAPYRALVCVFLNGGNDSNNMVVPIGAGPYGSYNSYFTHRGAQSLALPQPGTGMVNDLLPLLSGGNVPAATGATLGSFAFHPGFASATYGGLRDLFDTGKLAVVANVGTLRQPLVSPTPRQAYLNAGNSGRPFQLFSHSDQIQQWQSCRADVVSATGWGGRLADHINPSSTALPQITSISGNQTFTVGTMTSPLTIGTGALNTVLVLNGFGTAADEVARRNAFNQMRTIDRTNNIVAANSDLMDQAVAVSQQLSVDPTLTTAFPNTTLGNQLRQVAKVIKANLQNISPMLNRQIFFCSLGGFDTHSNELTTQGGGINTSGQLVRGLLGQLSDAMAAFYTATQELNGIQAGISSRITLFTMADFNRTFNPAGSGAGTVGSDHAWGSHQFVLGDGVSGGKFYGVAIPTANSGTGTVFQNISMLGSSNPYDASTRGLFVPSCSVDQYAHTLANWYGLTTPTEVAAVFPLLSRFSPATLGFMI